MQFPGRGGVLYPPMNKKPAIADTNNIDKPGKITIYDKKSNKNNLCNNIEIKFKRK